MDGERDFVFVATGYYIEEGEGPPIIEVESPLSSAFHLFQGYPNPFSCEMIIQYALPKKTRVKVGVYDASGRSVKKLIDAVKEPGYYRANWEGEDFRGRKLPSGVYFVRMESEEFKSTRKVVLVK